MVQQNPLVRALIILVVGLGLGYFIGSSSGYKAGFAIGDSEGYKRAEADIKRVDEEAAKKAAVDVAKAANPFQVTNPLEGVEANPFDKVKKILNPFE